ncbi:MAG: hypothetical protein K8S87_11930 [Planctomycetes bacterium]|nr:hypothetical protein [Planctomycetota bacterium]
MKWIKEKLQLAWKIVNRFFRLFCKNVLLGFLKLIFQCLKLLRNNLLLVFIFGLGVVFVLYMLNLPSFNQSDISKWGTWGDAFGMFNGLAFLIAMYALYLQKKEVKEAEQARRKRDLANITSDISTRLHSKKSDIAGNIIIFFNYNKQNYEKACKGYFNLLLNNPLISFGPKFDKNDPENIYGTERMFLFRDLLDSLNYVYNIFYDIYVLCKSKVIDEDFIKLVLTENDKDFILTYLKPHYKVTPYYNAEVFKSFEDIFPEYVPLYKRCTKNNSKVSET